MQQLGVGIAGAGMMGRAHATILADHPATRVVAVTSRQVTAVLAAIHRSIASGRPEAV